MIAKRTVFVLGAGASMPYGWPSSSALLRRALEPPKTARAAITLAAGVEEWELSGFIDEVQRSRTFSIDAYLEKHPDNKKIQSIGKTLIAHGLARSFPEHKNYPKADDCWIGYLWNRMHARAGTVDEALSNVSFVTFNFDHSLEAVLTSAASAMYRVDNDAVLKRVKNITVHVHGALPLEPDPTHVAADSNVDWLKRACTSINVVHEAGASDALRVASLWLDDAKVVCFLGFGYHEANLRKLGYRRDGTKNGDAKIFGCAKGKEPGEVAEMRRMINPPSLLDFSDGDARVFGKPDEDAVKFLRTYDVLATL